MKAGDTVQTRDGRTIRVMGAQILGDFTYITGFVGEDPDMVGIKVETYKIKPGALHEYVVSWSPLGRDQYPSPHLPEDWHAHGSLRGGT